MMDKLVSIGMSVYNCSKFVEDAIVSVLKQTYTNWELIIVNDGSTDDTLEKIKTFKDGRIKVFSDNENRGLPTRLNECIELSRGFYFARMDGDDIMMPNRLETQVNYLETHTDIDVVGSLAIMIDEKTKDFAKKTKYVPQSLNDVISSGSYFIHPTVMGHLGWFKQHKYDTEAYRVEDFELWVRTFESSNFFISDDYLLFYREVMTTYRSKYYQSYLSTKKVLQKYKDKMPDSLYYSTVGKAYVKYLLFDVFKKLGLLNRKTEMNTDEKVQFQTQLDKIIQKY